MALPECLPPVSNGGMRHLVISLLAVLALGCGRTVDLTKSVTIQDVGTGWYDAGNVDGKNKLVPSISFTVKNTSAEPIARVQLMAMFHQVGDEAGQWGEHYISAIGGEALPAGATTKAFVLRSTLGNTGVQARQDLLKHPQFVDATVTLFGKQGRGNWTKLGDYKIVRQLLAK